MIVINNPQFMGPSIWVILPLDLLISYQINIIMNQEGDADLYLKWLLS
jgi:hypothetical protein